jgi:superfamily II DNA/RNA helicase
MGVKSIIVNKYFASGRIKWDEIDKTSKIAVGTPGSMLILLRNMDISNVHLIVLDEVDELYSRGM